MPRRPAPGPRRSRRGRRPNAPAPRRAAGRPRRCRTGSRSPRGRRRRGRGCTGVRHRSRRPRRARPYRRARRGGCPCGDRRAVPCRGPGRRGLDGVGHQVPAGDLARGQARLLLQEGDEIAVADVVAEAPDGLEVTLLVELEALGGDRPVEVDGELGDAQEGSVDVDEAAGAVAQGEPAGDAEVAVEPGVEQRAAVDLHGDLAPAVRAAVGAGLDPQVGGVGVGADDAEGGVGGGALRHVPGDDRAAAQHVLAAQRSVPRVGLRDLPEARLLQPFRGARHRVVRGGAARQEGHQVVGVAAVEAWGCAHGVHLNDVRGPAPGGWERALVVSVRRKGRRTDGQGPSGATTGMRPGRGCPESVLRGSRTPTRPAPSGPARHPRRSCGRG